MRENNKFGTHRVVGIAVFSALAYVTALVCNVIPPIAGFLSLDIKDAIISIASFIYGPISGVIIAFIAAFIEFITFSTTAWYGFIMNFASSAVFALSVALIYERKRTINGALVGFLVAVVLTTGVMLLLNNFVTPIYLYEFVGMPKDDAVAMVVDLLPRVLLPFNFAKAMLNASVALFLYRPLLAALGKAGLVPGKKTGMKINKNTAVISAVGAVCLAVAVVILVVLA